MKSVEKLPEEKDMTKTKELCVGETLTDLLAEKKISPKELSKKTKIPFSTIHHILSNRPIKNIMTLEKIADALGVSLHFLLFGKADDREVKITTIPPELFSGLFEIVIRKHEK